MTLKNGKYSLKALQLAYFEVTMKDNTNDTQCVYCWNTGCGCSTDTVKNDPFLTSTNELELSW